MQAVTVAPLACWYFAGVVRSIAGQKEEAADRFRNCLATKREDYVEYQLAQAELRKLE